MNNPMNSAVRKIHNLLSSGAVTVTGPNQPRILKQKVGSTTVTSTGNTNNSSLQQNNYGGSRCYVCDDTIVSSSTQNQLTEMNTSHTNTKFPNKIGQLVGDAFMVIVSVEDVVCSRCTNLINYLDRLENDVERVRTNIMNLLHKKYGLNDDGGGGGTSASNVVSSQSGSPPVKMQKLNSGNVAVNRVAVANSSDDGGDRVRKGAVLQTVDSTVGKQTPPVSAVQQIKISTPQSQQSSTQTVQRKTTKIYKCLSCDYKTSDMRLFNTHYESCKQQNFQCKNCKKIFPNFGAMKQHMIKDHNTPMDNTCAVCHINFVSDQALRKHMEINHSTNVVVTSSTTIPAAPAAEAITQSTTTSTPLYTCNHCQFKSTDKPIFDEHMRKHMAGGNKPKPFKCRLCSQRFETREQATVHAKQHQPNYFKCGTCSMSFPKRELLVKHFEVHQQQRQPSPQPTKQLQTNTMQQQQQQQQQQHQQQQQTVTQTQPLSNTMLTTQKLLQETIDEALSDSVSTNTADASGGGAANSNIRFFSCHICSLTFIQENYYNQHMETHKREKKASAVTTTASSATLSNSSSLGSLNSTTTLLADGHSTTGTHKSNNNLGTISSGGDTMSRHSNATTSAASISEADIESIFEKMHSDKGDGGNEAASVATTSTAGNTTAAGDNLVITSQAGSGGITFNITIPQPDGTESRANTKSITTPTTTAPVSVSIDMPVLDHSDELANTQTSTSAANANQASDMKNNSEAGAKQTSAASGPVSMPSLDDDNDAQEQQEQQQESEEQAHEQTKDKETSAEGEEKNSIADGTQKSDSQENDDGAAASNSGANIGEEHDNNASADEANHEQTGEHQQVTMELDEAMQAQVEGGQIKFILNENGQLLQLDNHIITDADGNQILVQDPEQIQQLLQSVGVLQSGDGLDGETLQMMTDANGQMVLVQGDNNETQLIDASLLNADGQLVIQQGQDGDLSEGAHVIGEDGTRIPVSVSYTADGQPIVQVQQQVMENADGQQIMLDKEGGADNAEDAQATAAGGGSSTGRFFALEDLMQQSSDADANAKEAD